MNKNPRLQFVHQLEEHVRQYLIKLEQMLGPRDPRFVFGTVRMTFNVNDVPHTHFPIGYHFNGTAPSMFTLANGLGIACHQIRLFGRSLTSACTCWIRGKLGSANILEEGLASWFQDEPKFHNEKIRGYIARIKRRIPSYVEAKKLVLACKPESHLCSAVKKIRASGVRIRDIEEEMLESHLPTSE